MNRRLYHPLWTHIPAALISMLMIILAAIFIPASNAAPVHFGLDGRPDRYGSPWEVAIGLIGLSILYIGTSVVIDELWARQEDRKTFNWMSLFDEISVGALLGFELSYIAMLSSGRNLLPSPWFFAIPISGVAAFLAVLIEKRRPYQPHEVHINVEDTAELEEEIAKRRELDLPMVYWESQNPVYNTVLAIIVSVTMLIGGVITWIYLPWTSTVMFISAFAFLVLYGGIRVMVTPNRLVVNLGILGVHLLNLDTQQISSVQVIGFSPLRDFGGYGIRVGRGMVAFYMRGNRGVLVTTRAGKKFLIGSDHPERLAAVLKSVME